MHRLDFEKLVDAVADLQARTMAQSALLDALIMSHPDRDALTEAWRHASSGKVSAQSMNVAFGTQVKAQEYSLEQFERLTKRVEGLRIPKAPPE